MPTNTTTLTCTRSCRTHGRTQRIMSLPAALMLLAGIAAVASPARAQVDDPAPMLQWFECRWYDMERRMGDYFMAGYGSVWLPPVSVLWR